jgi:SAM-dependent methyltransferase
VSGVTNLAAVEARERLLELVRCPACGSAVAEGRDEVVCLEHGHAFPVVEGVLVMIDDDELRRNRQYEHQRGYFDAEFSRYGSYRLDAWRVSYLNRLRGAGALAPPVVDVGVGGSGATVIEVARTGGIAVGCDLSLTGLVQARNASIAEAVGDRTLWVCCSAERLPLATATFASALAIAVLEHVPDDAAALAEAARVLRPGGRAWVTVPHALRHIAPVFRLPNILHDRRLGHLRRYSARELVTAASEAGLRALDVQFTGHAVKVGQLAAERLPGRLGPGAWWWCEERDLRRRRTSRGSMQLSAVFERAS